MKTFALLLALALQLPQATPLPGIRATLRQLHDQYDAHRTTFGATAELSGVKQQLRDWIEGQLAREGENVDTRAFAQSLHVALRDGDLICNDCDEDVLGYLDDVRVSREGGFLVVVVPVGISCSYDDSAYVYGWRNGRWQRVLEHEQNTYTQQGYTPEAIHDVQVSAPDASGRVTLLILSSQPICRGSFKNIYARAWRILPDARTELVLDRKEMAYDDYPPILGRVLPNDVMFQFTAGGFLSGDVHVAARHFTLDGNTAAQVDPVAALPRDFVLEWLSASWDESRTRSDSDALQAQHAQLRRTDAVGDFAEATRRCTASQDLWQVGTRLFEGPKRYYRIRWQAPYTFTMVSISETAYPDCTVNDARGEDYPNLLGSRVR